MLRTPDDLGSRPLWTSADFLGIAGASLMLGLGYQIYVLDFPLLVNALTHRSPVAMGALQGIEFLPNLLLAVLIGVVVDRVSKRRFILAATVLRAVVLLGVFALFEAGDPSLSAILVSAFLLSAVFYAFHNARTAIVKLAFARERLTEVNASLSFLQQVVAIAGPAGAGFALAAMPLRDGIAVIGVTAVAGLAFLRVMRFSDDPAPARGSFSEDLKDGWAELRHNRSLWSLSMIVIFTNSTEGMFAAMFLYFAKDRLHLGNAELGLLLTIASLGAA
ncbi:MAG: MFS transporter, partial [Thermaerobacter sp.]|nr:MFS transporter [Thermaerobacter sp.]